MFMPDLKKLASHFPCHYVPSHHSSRLKAGRHFISWLPFWFGSSPRSSVIAMLKMAYPSHSQDYLTQLTNSPQWKHLFTEDPVVNWVILPESFCSCFHNHVKVFQWGKFWFCVGEGLCYVWPVEGQIIDPLTDFIWFYKLHGKCFN